MKLLEGPVLLSWRISGIVAVERRSLPSDVVKMLRF